MSASQPVIPSAAEAIVYVRLMPHDPINGYHRKRHVICSTSGGKGDLFEAGKWYKKPLAFGQHAERYQRQDANNPRSPRLFQVCWTKAEWEDVVRTERRRALGLDRLDRSSEQREMQEGIPPVPTGHMGIMDPLNVDLRIPEEKKAAPMAPLFDDDDASVSISDVPDEPMGEGRGDLKLSDVQSPPGSVAAAKRPSPKAPAPKAPAKKTTLVGQRKK